jgi:acyl carrier protein phosphodiesterase
MITQNWLVGYRDPEVLRKVFYGMSRRTSRPSGMENAVVSLMADYAFYEKEFRTFFPQIIHHIEQYRRNFHLG